MMNNRLQQKFFTIPTVRLAKALLGCTLVREMPSGRLAGTIIETEAYTEDDPAAHSFGGRRTKRNEVMFAPGGYAYVYVSYGIHHCLNIVSGQEGRGDAVLIRAIAPTEGIAQMRKSRGGKKDALLADGPGKLCQAFAISLAENGINMTDAAAPLYVLPRDKRPTAITATPRVGISKARNRPWRFLLE